MNISLSAFAPENLVSPDGFGSPVPRQPAHLHTQAESGAYLRDSSQFPRRRPFIYLNRKTPWGPSRVYRVTQLRTNGVHCREPACTGPPVNLKVVPNGCCLGRSPWNHLVCASLSHTYYLLYWYEVGTLKVSNASGYLRNSQLGFGFGLLILPTTETQWIFRNGLLQS